MRQVKMYKIFLIVVTSFSFKQKTPLLHFFTEPVAHARGQTNGMFSSFDLSEDVDKLQTKFTKTLLSAAEKSIPKGSRAKYQVFWNGDLEEAVNKRRKARKLVMKNPSPENKREYKTLSQSKVN